MCRNLDYKPIIEYIFSIKGPALSDYKFSKKPKHDTDPFPWK
jgi:hypothetical protein